ncbi:protein FAM98A-like [Ylistrum balloti]|uniref:protein FAM98A-like n=1 Tax=Ylistrum balloti TaxID=509963 RepID=UPI002905B5F1|nr:protein FAM98A-like [Ylistrum balloti]
MENDILDSLEDLRYDGPLSEEQAFNDAVEAGPASVEYTKLVAWLTGQLRDFCGLEECANAINSPDEASNFIMELGSCLRELNCPYKELFEGTQVSDRLNTKKSRLQLLDYLTSELASVRMIAAKQPSQLKANSAPTSTKPVEMIESDVAKHLRILLIALEISKPPASITSFQLFSKVEAKIQDLVSKFPNQAGTSLLKARLSDKQWDQVLKINEALCREYQTRREMLLKRLDVTVQSFMWSEKAKQKENDIAAVYQPVRKSLQTKPAIGVAQILSARDDLTRLEKTSSGDAREKTKCAINRVLIPKVPDRGGRAWELEPPPPEMPSFMKREAAPQRPQSGHGGGRGRGGGGGGGGRGGKVQGGWGDANPNQQGGNWGQGGGGYNQGRGGGGYGNQGGGYGNQGGGYGGQGGGYGNQGGGYGGQGGGYGNQGGGYGGQGGGYGNQGGGYGGQGGGGGYHQGGQSDNYQGGGGGGGRGGRGRKGSGRGGRGRGGGY